MSANNAKKRTQTTLRLTNEQKRKIDILAADSSMTDVISKGIEAEWNYYINSAQLLKKVPQIKNKEELAKWAADTFKDSPENLSKFSTAVAINNHTKAINDRQKKYELLVNEFDTLNYLIRAVGNNLNQLTHQANQGVSVPKDELASFTQAIFQLNDIVTEMRKEVKSHGIREV